MLAFENFNEAVFIGFEFILLLKIVLFVNAEHLDDSSENFFEFKCLC